MTRERGLTWSPGDVVRGDGRILAPSLGREPAEGAVSPDGSRIALVAWPVQNSAGLVVLRASDDAVIVTRRIDVATVGAVTFDGDGERVLVVGGDGGGRIASIDMRGDVVVTATDEGAMSAIAIGPGRLLATAEGYAYALRLTLRDPDTFAVIRPFVDKRAEQYTGVADLAFSPNGRWLASADDGSSSEDGVGRETGQGDIGLVVWDVALGTPVHRFPGTRYAASVAFHPDGVRLASASIGGVEIRDVERGEIVMRIATRHTNALAFVRDGDILLTAGDDEGILAWNMADGSPAGAIAGPGQVRALRSSRDGRVAVAVGWRRTAAIAVDTRGRGAIGELDVSANDFGDAGMEALAASSDLTNTRGLRARFSRVRAAGVIALAASAHSARLEVLDLGGNDIGSDGALAIGATWSHLTCLRELDIDIACLDETALACLLASPALERLVRLHVCGDLVAFAAFRSTPLPSSPRLMHLSITWRNFVQRPLGPRGAAILAASPHLGALESLAIDGAHAIGDAGLIALLESPHLRALKSLDVDANGITSTGVSALASSALMGRLESLSLRRNEAVTHDALLTLLASPHLTSLRHLDLSELDVRADGARAILASPFATKLERLDLSGCRIHEHAVPWIDQGVEIGATPADPEAAQLRARFGANVVL